MLITAPWPDLPDGWIDADADAEIDWLIDAGHRGALDPRRDERAALGPPAADAIGAGAGDRERAGRAIATLIARLWRRLGASSWPTPRRPARCRSWSARRTGALAIADFIDLAAERARLAKDIAALDADIDRTAKKLANPDFVARAPPMSSRKTATASPKPATPRPAWKRRWRDWRR